VEVSPEPSEVPTTQKIDPKNDKPDVDLHPQDRAIATFAGGCFWCMEKPFEVIDGVDAVYSGYTGGPEINPSYKDVAGGRTGHTEAVRIIYDPQKVSYELLLNVFWRNIDPTQVNGQFVDHGRQYRTGIYTHDDEQMRLSLKTRDEVQEKFQKPIVTEILAAQDFYVAETYHQDFYKTNPRHYQGYRKGSGRDRFLENVWGEEAGGYSLHGGKH
jgi:methionine-S-sulfoxide reductase